MTLLLLIILVAVLVGGASSYDRWGSTYPAWGGNLLWVLAAVVLVLLVLSFAGHRL